MNISSLILDLMSGGVSLAIDLISHNLRGNYQSFPLCYTNLIFMRHNGRLPQALKAEGIISQHVCLGSLCCSWEEARGGTEMLNRLILHGISNRLRFTTEFLCVKNWESHEGSRWGSEIILWSNRNVCQGHRIQCDSELHVAIARLEILPCKDIQNVLMETNCETYEKMFKLKLGEMQLKLYHRNTAYLSYWPKITSLNNIFYWLKLWWDTSSHISLVKL